MINFESAMGAAISGMVSEARRYSRAYKNEFSSPIGEDAVLGEAMSELLRAAHALLNGPLGKYDGGALSKEIHAVATEHGLLDENGEL